MTTPTGLRIGAKVRSLVDDCNVHVGLEGLIVNVMPPRPTGFPHGAARVNWANDTCSIANAETFEVIPQPAVVQPTVMAAFPTKEAS